MAADVRGQHPRKESLPRDSLYYRRSIDGPDAMVPDALMGFYQNPVPPNANKLLDDAFAGLPSINPAEEERFWPTLGLIVFFSILGALVRVGVVQLNTFPNEPVFPLVWAQIVGCLIYGFCASRKKEIASISFPLYVGLTTGLCGTITTFSSFMETTFRNLVGSPTYSSLGTHVVFVNVIAAISVVGVTLGMAVVSVLFGNTISKILPENSRLLLKSQYEVPSRSIFSLRGMDAFDWASLFLGIAAWAAAIVVLVISRNYMYFLGTNLAFTCVLAPIGSIIRWQLARLNKTWKLFPVGTFTANILGTTIRAICSMLLIRLDAGHMSPVFLSAITGIKDGFCGGLTTLSTLANEIMNLPPISAVLYTTASIAASQIIIGAVIFPFALPPSVVPFLVSMPPIELCSSYKYTCDHFLYRIGCPAVQWTSRSCSLAGDLTTLNGTCTCGNLDVSKRIQESLLDMQLKPYLPALFNTTVMQGVFAAAVIEAAPKKPGVDANAPVSFAKPFGSRRDGLRSHEEDDSLETVAVENGIINRAAVESTVASNKGKLAVEEPTKGKSSSEATASAKSVSEKASAKEAASKDTLESTTKAASTESASTQFVLQNIGSVPHMTVDICSSYANACSHLLDSVQCLPKLRQIKSCKTAGNAATFEGACLCGKMDASERVAELIMDSQVKGDIPFTKVHQPPLTVNGNWSISICPTYQRTCDSLMQRLSCPKAQITNTACEGTAQTQDKFVGECGCGEFDAGGRVFEDIIDNDVKPQIKDFVWESTKFTFWKTIDFCPTYTSVCSEFHARVGCPLNLQVNNACNDGLTVQAYKGECACGAMDAGERVMELITDFIVVPILPAIASPGAILINS
ncbi:hypothetical protein CcCBS67573_g02546 [Chytriomyces confervae]|uniref:Uncharacterized protein n=1 Tax=Chytriomyces confervae TaxID=246404 RepID=A0A507FL80_9FUNG|nr:hypothetical protein CcCBS67573_g02546 [Chytriomyces confervae]